MEVTRNFVVSKIQGEYYATHIYNYTPKTIENIVGIGREWVKVQATGVSEAIRIAKDGGL